MNYAIEAEWQNPGIFLSVYTPKPGGTESIVQAIIEYPVPPEMVYFSSIDWEGESRFSLANRDENTSLFVLRGPTSSTKFEPEARQFLEALQIPERETILLEWVKARSNCNCTQFTHRGPFISPPDLMEFLQWVPKANSPATPVDFHHFEETADGRHSTIFERSFGNWTLIWGEVKVVYADAENPVRTYVHITPRDRVRVSVISTESLTLAEFHAHVDGLMSQHGLSPPPLDQMQVTTCKDRLDH